MNIILGVLGFVSSLPGFVFVIFVFTILGVCFGVKFRTAITSAIMISAGVLAIQTMTEMMVGYVAPLGTALVANSGIQNDIIDIGIGPVFGAVVSLPFFIFLYPIGLAVNFALVKIGWTKTVNVDFLDLFAILLPFIPFYIMTGNVLLTLTFSIIFYAIVLKISDYTAKYYEEYFGLEGISLSHPFDAFTRILALMVDWIIDRIPGLNRINFNIKDMQANLGLFGEPEFLSFIIGLVLSLIAKLDIGTGMAIGAAMAANCIVYPKAIGILMEGIRPISVKMRDVMQNKFKVEDALIGMDSSIVAGYPEAIAVGAILMPISFALYFILPGVNLMPTGAMIASQLAGLILPLVGAKGKKGNIFRCLLVGVLVLVLEMYCTTWITPIVTEFCMSSGMALVEGAKVTSSVLSHPLGVLIAWILKFFGF